MIVFCFVLVYIFFLFVSLLVVVIEFNVKVVCIVGDEVCMCIVIDFDIKLDFIVYYFINFNCIVVDIVGMVNFVFLFEQMEVCGIYECVCFGVMSVGCIWFVFMLKFLVGFEVVEVCKNEDGDGWWFVLDGVIVMFE